MILLSVPLWGLRLILIGSALLKLLWPHTEGSELWLFIAVLELLAAAATFVGERARASALRVILWGFLGAGVGGSVLVLVGDIDSSVPCGCLGSKVVLRRGHSLLAQGAVAALACVALHVSQRRSAAPEE